MAGLRVRGTCKRCGYVVDTTAPEGKATWRGACPNTACGARITAHRLKDTDSPIPPGDGTPPPTATAKPGGRQRRKPIKADGYARPAPRPEPTPGEHPDVRPTPPGEDRRPPAGEPREPASSDVEPRERPRVEPPRAREPERRRLGITPYDDLY